MHTMKIAFIGQKGIPAVGGGVERYVEDVAVRLAAHGHDVIVYTRPNYTPASQKEHKGVTLRSLPSIATKHLDAGTHSFLASVHAVFAKVDVIHYQSIGPAFFSWIPKILRPKTKIVSTLQSRDYEHMKWGAFARFMLKVGESIMCRCSDELIVVSEAMRNYVATEYNLSPTVIPNGANLYEVLTETNHLKNWDLTKDGYIVAISRLVRHKGLSHLVKAYQSLTTDKKLVIVGTGAYTDDYVQELHDLAAGDPHIIFTGSQTDAALAQLYSHAYLFVQPSESEGLSLALLEAMARRKAVLVSDIRENTEAIGDTGFVFKNKDVADLKCQLEMILANPAEALRKGEAARARIESHYNWDTIVIAIENMYNRAHNRNNRHYAFRETLTNN